MSSSLKKIIVRNLLGFVGVIGLCVSSTASAGTVVCPESTEITGVECFYEVEGHGLLGNGTDLPVAETEGKQSNVEPLVNTIDDAIHSLLTLIEDDCQ